MKSGFCASSELLDNANELLYFFVAERREQKAVVPRKLAYECGLELLASRFEVYLLDASVGGVFLAADETFLL